MYLGIDKLILISNGCKWKILRYNAIKDKNIINMMIINNAFNIKM